MEDAQESIALPRFTIALIIRSLDLRWSAEIGSIAVLLTLHSAGVRESGHVAFY